MLLGGVYLDIWISPVSIDRFPNVEYSNLDTVRIEPGGSAFFVGKHLWTGFTHKCYLFSRVGEGDVFSKQLAKLLKNCPWTRGNHLSTSQHSQCGVSIHLLDRARQAVPTLTHKGALSELSWSRVLKDLQHVTRRGAGVLYISGFFRTGLSRDLDSSIRALAPDTLVLIDHGRFQASDDPAAANSLLDAFRSGLIDIYICTYAEITTFADAIGLTFVRGQPHIETIEYFAQSEILPKVTVVRGDPINGVPTAIIAIDAKVQLIEEGPRDWTPRNRPGEQDAFTAGFINYLYTGDSRESLEDILTGAVGAGLKFWATRG